MNITIEEEKIDKINSTLWNSRYNNPSEAAQKAMSILARSEEADYQKGMAYSRLIIAACSFLQSKNDTAHENLSRALLWFSDHTYEPGYPLTLNLKGNLYESVGDYEKALHFCLQAHKLSLEINDPENVAETCSQLGMIYTRLCNYPKALEYYHEGFTIREKMKDENAMASSLNRIGMIMRLTRKYEESLDYYNRSLEIRRRNNQVTSIQWTLLGMASTFEEMKKTTEALGYYENGMVGGDIRCTLQCMMGSGRIYSILGNTEKAQERLEESLKMAMELKATALVADAYSALANHYESTGNAEKALKYFKLFHQIKESLQSEEVQTRLRNIEISHAIEKSVHEKEIYRLRHVELKNAYDIIEGKNKDITASINYASRIQRAMLPDPAEIKGFNQNGFILYLPKDIVSGDFYWFNKTGEKLIVAAGDCTGHGVPGALMSMLGISFLEEIINNRGIIDTGEILNELRKEIINALHKKITCNETKDGIDISICIIDNSKDMIQYSGAFNNLYLIRDKELIEFRADRMPVGMSGLSEKKFTSHMIPILRGDTIYMFSDGYADQFGGRDNKKFKYPAFKKLLTDIHSLPTANQKFILEKKFNDWKGNIAQIDDVMIIGLKL